MITTFRTAAQLGGIAHGIQQRKQAEDRYYANPNYCLECKQMIQLTQEKKVSDVKAKKFCNCICAARFNNRKSPKKKRTKKCKTCSVPILCSHIYCQVCTPFGKSHNKPELPSKIDGALTKGEIFKIRKNWQAARTAIRAHAYTTYWYSNPKRVCAKEGCEFNLHIEVCHKRAVASFPDTALVAEINALDNLIGFCPNHHWEFDHVKNSQA